LSSQRHIQQNRNNVHINKNRWTTRNVILMSSLGCVIFLVVVILSLIQHRRVLVSDAQTPSLAPNASSTNSLDTTLLPPGSKLPSDAECAARVVRNPWEPRPDNTTANNTNVYSSGYRMPANEINGYGARVTGNFTGTTDEIIQWAACKWGFDVNTVRAQAVIESYWRQSTMGDCIGNSQQSTNGCQSVGLLQVRGADLPPTHAFTWPYAQESTAFNVDYALAFRRDCYEGKLTWLNTVDHTGTYTAGDEWGCMGVWFAGRWHTAAANDYIQKVQAVYADKEWTTWNASSGMPTPTQSVPTQIPTQIPLRQSSPFTPTPTQPVMTSALQVTTTGAVTPSESTQNSFVLLTATVQPKNANLINGIVDLEVYRQAAGGLRICQTFISGVSIAQNDSQTISTSCQINGNEAAGNFVLRIGVFGSNWSPLYSWNSNAATFVVK